MEGSSSNYYSILGVTRDSSLEEIRRSYRRLALQWHPDRWSRAPALSGEAKRKFQQIQEAYSVLSDERKKMMYDAGLYDPDDDEDEGLSDFVQEMLNLMAQERKQKKQYSMEELQGMLMDLAQDFESPSLAASPSWWSYQHPTIEDTRCSKRTRWATETKPVTETTRSHLQFQVPAGLHLYGTRTSGFCN